MIRISTALIFGACVAPGLVEATDFSSLLNNSPFANVANGANGSGGDKSLELRGMYMESGVTYFNILDPTTQRASWVSMNEIGHPFVVRGYNQANDTVTIEVNGHNLNLGLKHAAVQLAAKPVTPAPGPAMQPGDAGPQRDRRFGAMGPDGRPDPKRMEAFIEEMRRRRAARMQGQTPDNQGPQPQPGTGPVPTPMVTPAPADPNNPPQR